MFSNTAYEAMYEYIGLQIHSTLIGVITSQKVFLGMILLIFGWGFFSTAIQFFSRYIPGVLVARRPVPLSRFVRVVAMLFLGISILRIGSTTDVKRFTGESWAQNPYIHGHVQNVAPEYRVSFVFDLMSRSAEEFASLLNHVVDHLFQTTHSELQAPDFFFKALMYGAANTIEDKDLKESIHLYTDECFDRMLPLIAKLKGQNKLDGFFASSQGVDEKLATLDIPTADKTPYTCLDLKNDLQNRLKSYAESRPGIGSSIDTYLKNNGGINSTSYANYQISNFLVNEYQSHHEALAGIQKASELPSTGGQIVQYFNRLTSFDGILSLFSNGSLQGSWVAASRSQEFSENLARAPHVAGFIKMLLIGVFPLLIFPVIAGRWKTLIYWWLIYFSVLLWAPIWTLLYQITNSIALSADVLEAWGKLNDGVSLYSGELISSRIYHLYAVYSWLQVLIGLGLTGWAALHFRPILSDTEANEKPDQASVVAERAKGVASHFSNLAEEAGTVLL